MSFCVRVISNNVITMTPDDTPFLTAYHKPPIRLYHSLQCPVSIRAGTRRTLVSRTAPLFPVYSVVIMSARLSVCANQANRIY